jgi:hypothetical protein
MTLNEYVNISIKIAFFAGLAFYAKTIGRSLWKIFAGEDNIMSKEELGGFVFLGLLVYMIYKEGQREFEWHLYSDLWVVVVSVTAIIGLGMRDVIDAIVKIKNGQKNE